jgi:hypothetical protein
MGVLAVIRLSKPKLVVAFVASLVTSALLVLVPQQAANAAYGCSGAWVSRGNFNDIDGMSVASIERYEGPAGNTDCYALVSRGQYAGVSKYMSFTVCQDGTAASCRSNSGNFTNYAGPLQAAGCTSGYVIIRDPGGRTILHFQVWIGSCD